MTRRETVALIFGPWKLEIAGIVAIGELRQASRRERCAP